MKRPLLALLSAAAAARAQPAPQPTYANLTDGAPVLGYVAAGASAFFRFVAPLPMPRLDVVVVPIAGAPALYVTLGRYWDPEPGNSLFAAPADFGDEVVRIPFNASASVTLLGDSCSPKYWDVCWVNVNVFGARAANFSLTLTTSAGSGALSPGVATVGELAPGEADFYTLMLPQPAPASVSFRVAGSPAGAAATPALLVSSSAQGAARPNASDPTSFCASAPAPSRLTGAASVAVANTSACACAPQLSNCTFYASVVRGAGGGAAATYSLLAVTSATAFTLLAEGSPALGAGAAGAPGAQYVFYASGTGASRVEVVAAPTSGAVVLYALLGAAALAAGGGAGPGAGAPGALFATAGGPGPQSLSIAPGDARWIAACGADPLATCPVLIGVVTSSLASAFSIVARAAAYAQLASGVPQPDSAPAGGAAALFRFSVGAAQAGQAVVISVAVTSGDAALFVGCDSNNATARPTGAPGSFLWSSTSVGDELVVIDPADPNACAPPCSYYVGVVSADAARGVGFVALARTNSSTQTPTALALGEVLLDAVAAGGASFFSLAWPLDALGAPAESVDVSAFSSVGSVALLARLDNASIADAGASYAAAVSGPGEWQTITIASTDAAWAAAPSCGGGGGGGDLTSCAVAIVVAGNTTSSASQFLVTAASGLTQLADGVAVEATVAALPAMRYFRYSAADATPFTVSLAVLSGDADLFVSALAPPNASTAQWQSRLPAALFVNVQFTEPWLRGVSFPIDFFVGVGGFDGAAAFSLVASSNAYAELSPGVPFAAEARAGVLQIFLLQVPPADVAGGALGFSVALSPVTGDPAPRLFLNTVNKTQSCAHCGWPSCRTTPCEPDKIDYYNRRWSSEEAANPLFCEVDVNDANYESGTMYVIAVLAAADATFELTASFTDAVTYLVDQVPTPSSVNDGDYKYFVVDVLNVDVQLFAFLTVTAGRADLFVSVNSTNRRPSAARYDKAALAGSGGAQAVAFSWPELAECPGSSVQQTISCNVFFGVRGATGDNSSSAFSILADVAKPNATAFLLEDGVPIEGVIRPSDYEEFYVPLELSAETPFFVTLTPYGVAKLVMYLTLDGSRPGPTNFLRRTNGNQGTETITVLPSDADYCGTCVLRSVVHCPFMGWVGFEIVYSAVASPQLLPARPTLSSLQVTWKRAWRLSVPTPAAADSVDVAFMGLSGKRATLTIGVAPPGANASWAPGAAGDPSTCFSAALTAASPNAAMHAPRGRSACSALCPGPGPCTYVVAVGCPGTPYKEPTCAFALVATTSASQVVQLEDGQPLYGAVAESSLPFRFYSIDISLIIGGALGNITLGATAVGGGAVQLLATNVPGALPTLDSAVWRSGVNASGRVSVSIGPGDAALLACPNCTLLTFAVYAPSASLPPGGVGFYVSATSDGGTPARLLLGQPSQPTTVNYRGVAQYVVFLQSSDADLLVEPTVISGLLAYSVDPFAVPQCVVGVAPARVIRCSGLWTVANADAAGPLRIRAAAPCASANSSLPCDPATAWRVGPYFISTIAFYSPTTHIVTATQPGLVVVLVDGQAQAAAATTDNAATFSFATAEANALPVTVTLSAQARGLAFFVAVCALSTCSAAQLAPGPASAPGVVLLSGAVPAQGVAQVVVSPGDAAFCAAASGDSCLYVIGVVPAGPSCPSATCFAALTVSATLYGSPLPPAPAQQGAGGSGAVSPLVLAGGAIGIVVLVLAVAAALFVRRHGGFGARRSNGDAGLLVIPEHVEIAAGSGRSSPASVEELAAHRAQLRDVRVQQLRGSLSSTPGSTPVLKAVAADRGGSPTLPALSLNASYSPPNFTT